jgi:hypothetical protein
MRIIRRNHPGVYYHLIARFVENRWFLDTPDARACYLRLLGRALADSDWSCLAYALMSNHIHLLMRAGATLLKSWGLRVHPPFAIWINDRLERIGPVFTRGPRDYAIPLERARHVIAYIHKNPVRAGVVARASDSTWTSHRAYAGLVRSPSWLAVDEGLALSGFTDRVDFAGWIDQEAGDPGYETVTEVQRTARKRATIEVATPSHNVVPLVARPGTAVRIDPRRVIVAVAAYMDLSLDAITSRRRNPIIHAARVIAVHVARQLHVAGADIAASLGITPQAVSKIALRPAPAALSSTIALVLERLATELHVRFAS